MSNVEFEIKKVGNGDNTVYFIYADGAFIGSANNYREIDELKKEYNIEDTSGYVMFD